jgi:hypothetical protein
MGLLRQTGSDRVGSGCLNRRHSLTSDIIASGPFLPVIVLVGQLYINLMVGVKILSHRQNMSISYQSDKSQSKLESLPKGEGFRYCKETASCQAAQSVYPYQTSRP